MIRVIVVVIWSLVPLLHSCVIDLSIYLDEHKFQGSVLNVPFRSLVTITGSFAFDWNLQVSIACNDVRQEIVGFHCTKRE